MIAGGVALFGPAGLAPGGSQTNENLCPQAVEAARKGVKLSALGKREKKGTAAPIQTPEKAIEDLGKGLKNLFGK